MTAAADIQIRAADTGKNAGGMFVQNPFVSSDFGNYLGHVRAFTLPAGEYAIWIKQSNQFLRYKDPHAGKSFQVVAGQTRYFGDFWILGCGTIRAGFRDNWAEVKDKFAQVYPGLNLNTVSMDVIANDAPDNGAP